MGAELRYAGLTALPFSDVGWMLSNPNWDQKLFNKRLGFILGIVDTTDYVETYGLVNPWTDFINLAFSTDPTIPAHTDPAHVPDPGLTALTTSRQSMRLP